MKTMELDACRNALARDILATDNPDVLKSVSRAYRRAVNRTKAALEKTQENTAPLAPYTLEELNARLDEAEADFASGKGIPSEIAHQRMKHFIANL